MIKKKSGFTLLEVSVILLVVSVALAALTPVMTKRLRQDGGITNCLWRQMPGNSDVITTIANIKSATVGVNGELDASNLTLRTGNDTFGNLINFYKNDGLSVSLSLGEYDESKLLQNINLASINDSIDGFSGESATLRKNTEYGESILIYDQDNTLPNNNRIRITGSNEAGMFSSTDKFGYHHLATIQIGDLSGNIGVTSESLVIATNPVSFDYLEGSVYVTNNVGSNDSARIESSVLLGGPFSNLTTATNSVLIGSSLDSVTSATNSVVIAAESPSDNAFNNSTTFVADKVYMGDFYGSVSATEATQSSDARLKDILGPYRYGLSAILQVQPYNFTYKSDKNKTPRVGVIAQDLQNVIPDAVYKFTNGKLRVKTDYIFYALVNAVKELDLIVTKVYNQAQSRIKYVETLIDAQDARIVQAQEKIQKQQERIDMLKENANHFQSKLNALKSL